MLYVGPPQKIIVFFAFAVIYATCAPTPSLGYLIFNKPQPPSPTSSNNKQFININIALRLWALALAARRACASRVVRFFALLHSFRLSSICKARASLFAFQILDSRRYHTSHLLGYRPGRVSGHPRSVSVVPRYKRRSPSFSSYRQFFCVDSTPHIQ